MMLGFGQATTGVVAAAPASSLDLYMLGLKAWASPSTAFSALGTTATNPGAALSGSVMPATLGLWTPPLLLAFVAIGAMGGKRRR